MAGTAKTSTRRTAAAGVDVCGRARVVPRVHKTPRAGAVLPAHCPRLQHQDRAETDQDVRRAFHEKIFTGAVATAVTIRATAQMTLMLIHAVRRKRRPTRS